MQHKPQNTHSQPPFHTHKNVANASQIVSVRSALHNHAMPPVIYIHFLFVLSYRSTATHSAHHTHHHHLPNTHVMHATNYTQRMLTLSTNDAPLHYFIHNQTHQFPHANQIPHMPQTIVAAPHHTQSCNNRSQIRLIESPLMPCRPYIAVSTVPHQNF